MRKCIVRSKQLARRLCYLAAFCLCVTAILNASAQCPPPLAIVQTNNIMQINWSTLGTLQMAMNLDGPWSDVTNGVGPINWLITSAPATFFRLRMGPQNVSTQSILFYNASSGSGAIGKVVNDQFVNQALYPSGSFSTGWTNLTQIPGPGGALFFFNDTTLNGAFGNLGANSFVTYMTESGFSPWTHVEGVMWQGSPYLFFYNATNGAAFWDTSYTLPAGFTLIERARQSGITLFYNADDGSGMLDFWPPTLTLGAGALPIGATHIASMPRPAGGDYVLFYRQTDGSAVLGWLDSSGFHTTLNYGPGSFGTWSHVVGLNSDFLFYNTDTGDSAIGTMLSDTRFVTLSEDLFSVGWTSIVVADLNTLMQGFCWPESAPPGGTIDFFTSTAADTYSVSYVQLLNQSPQLVTVDTIANNAELIEQVLCGPFTATGLMQNSAHTPAEGASDWTRSFSLTVPSTWASGIYAVKLADSAGSVTYVPFIVEPAPDSQADFLLIADTSTWNAYNPKFGYSRYEVPGLGAWQLSYMRPNPRSLNLAANSNWDAIQVDYPYMSKHLTRGELWIQNWLQASGYRVDVVTDLDLHAGVPNLNSYKGLILSTHPEYFSLTMFNNIQSYLARGGHLLYLGANGLFDAVDIAPDLKSLTVWGTAGCGRTHLFRELAQPESSVLGVSFPWSPFCDEGCGDMADQATSRWPYVALNASHPFFNGTGLSAGDQFGAQGWCVQETASSLSDMGASGASGWEIDVLDPYNPAPSGLQILARGMNPEVLNCTSTFGSLYNGTSDAANMVYYQTGVGSGFVFSVGSMSFGGSLVVDPVIQQIIRNALDACLH